MSVNNNPAVTCLMVTGGLTGTRVCCLEVLLEARENWLNIPDPTLWKTGDVHRLLVDTAAPRLTDVYRLTELAGVAVRTGLLVGTEAGAVAVAVTVPADIDTEVVRAASELPGEPAWAVVPVPGTTVELTPLGRYLVRLNLRSA